MYGPRCLSMTIGPFTYVVYAFEADIDVDFNLGMNIIRRFDTFYDPIIDAVKRARNADLSLLPEPIIMQDNIPLRTTRAISIDSQKQVKLDIFANLCSVEVTTPVLTDIGFTSTQVTLEPDVTSVSDQELLNRWAAGRRSKPGMSGR